ncbi:hypothetical protein FPV67DRAFT_167847 [Lyophyllum atratum]|nr:hypothetical protein FPV67DRAFT_167847 [Lyophyllum atratum]
MGRSGFPSELLPKIADGKGMYSASRKLEGRCLPIWQAGPRGTTVAITCYLLLTTAAQSLSEDMAYTGPPQNFFCDSCTQTILPTDPRIHCLTCHDYDLCANCAIGERFTKGHIGSHNIQVFKASGGGPNQPVLSTNTIVYTHGPPNYPNPSPNQPPPNYTQYGQGPPPPIPPRAANDTHSRSVFPPAAAPTLGGSGWQPFFSPDMTPTQTYTTLMNDIFSYLDPANTGNLLPETFSRFLDDMGYLTHENAWKTGLIATFNMSQESNADKTLKNAFDLFSIDHILLQRVQPPHVDRTGLTSTLRSVLGGFSPSFQAPSPPMPAITRKGFVDITVIEVLCDPSREWGNLNRMLRKYDLPRYRGWGDLPRSVLPVRPGSGDAESSRRSDGVCEAEGGEGD